MPTRYPGYDVLKKHDSPSWNEQTRRVVDERLAVDPDTHVFVDDEAWRTLRALCNAIVPQPPDRERPAPVAALLDRKLAKGRGDGYRRADMPPLQDAWTLGLRALEAEARARFDSPFHALGEAEIDSILRDIQQGRARTQAWGDMPPQHFFKERVLPDVLSEYYAHPHAWNEIGFGGPASPRGYVRVNYDMRDPWEAAEAYPGREDDARRANERV
jgi:hypothetical protein